MSRDHALSSNESEAEAPLRSARSLKPGDELVVGSGEKYGGMER